MNCIRYTVFISILAVVLGILSVLTNIHAGLSYPAWFDEAIISDIAYNFQHSGVWLTDSYSSDIGAWIYGPTYFYLQKSLIEIFGFSAMTMRSGNAAATYLIAVLVLVMVLQFTKSSNVALTIFVLFILDSSINRAAVVGRMDMVATLLSLLCFYLIYNCERISLWRIGLAGIFASLAFLTTPRSVFLLLGAVVLLLIYTVKHLIIWKSAKIILLQYALILILFFLPILMWIHSLGGLEHYVSAVQNSSYISQHEGFSLFRAEEDYVLLPLLFGLFLFSYKSAIREPLLIGIFTTFVCFTLFVKEVGPYRSMILPYLYIAGAIMAVMIIENWQLRYRHWLVYGAVAVTFLVSAPVFLMRSIDIWLVNSAARDAGPLRSTLLNKIPAGKFIAADYDYYYLLKPQAKRFMAFAPLLKSPSSQSQLPDYIVLTGESNAAVLKTSGKWAELLKTDYKLIGSYVCKVNTLGLGGIFYSRRNYDGTTVYAKQQ
ncbi:MAG: phospholipid carrier-dependent glycosyltransferase [Gammaproteobacteria bacterium]|nr:phospholipid carrier-dependent glycosyltransferase [Gammaproteobacteria bacterium]